jgi:hypothetical protein
MWRILKMRKKVLLGLLSALVLVAPFLGVFTQASLHLGRRVERVEKYEEGWLCGSRVYISYRATTVPYSTGFQLPYLLGAAVAQNQPRYMEINLEHMAWSTLNDLAGSPSETMPVFKTGALPTALRCDRPLPVESSWKGMLSRAMLAAVVRHKLVVFQAYKAVAIGRIGVSGPEWAGVSVPYERSARAWWSYPICAIAFVPAAALDVLTFPIILLLSFQH